MNTTAELPAPLPIPVRPITGETAESYIRRLARANHLRPSLLHVYVRDPLVPNRALQPERLAAASGRTVAALTHALTGLPKPRSPDRPHRRKPAGAQAARKERLFIAIRADATRGLTIREIAARHHTHRRMVCQALASPTPPPRKPINRPAPILDPIRDTIDAMRRHGNLTTWQIWTRLIDEHDADVSYGTVSDYIRSRTAKPDP
jgi:hypothetical protein